MSMDAILTLKEELLQLAEIFAEAVVKRIQPVKDELTRSQLGKIYGERWAQSQIRRGRLKGYRKGAYKNSPIIFSNLDAMTLKEAECRGAQMVRRDIAKNSES